MEVWFDSTSETLPEGMHGHFTTRGEIMLLNEDPNLALRKRPTREGLYHLRLTSRCYERR
jgi:hypothetical protein